MSSDFALCAEEVRKYDYCRYLCCLLAPGKIRNELFAVYAFNNEIAKIKDVVQQPIAGHIRLQWWRDAIDEVYNGIPVKHNHFVTNSLYKVISNADIDKNLFINLIDAREADIEFNIPENIASLKNYAIGTSSNLFYLLLAASGINDKQAMEASYYAGIAYAIIGIMRSMKYNIYNHRILFPKEMLNKQGITSEDLIDGKNLAKTKIITNMLCEKADVNLHHVRALIKDMSKDAFFVLLPTSLVELFLNRIKKCDYDLFNSDLEIGRLKIQSKLLASKVLRKF